MIEDYVKTLKTPTVIIQKSSDLTTFSFYNSDPAAQPQKVTTEAVPVDNTLLSFNSAGTSFNLYATPLFKDSGIIQAKIDQTCAFPVPFVSKGEPSIETATDKFTIRSTILGYKVPFTGSIYFQYKQYTQADIDNVYNTYINFEQFSDGQNQFYFCIYCPFYDLTKGPSLQFGVQIQARSKDVVKNLNEVNQLTDNIMIFLVPFAGSFTIKLEEIKEKLSFKFNATDVPGLKISYTEGAGAAVKVNSDFELENGENKKIIFDNSGLFSQTIQMSTTNLGVSSNAGIIAGSVIGVVAFLVILGLAIFFIKRFLKNRYPSNYPNGSKVNLQSGFDPDHDQNRLVTDDLPYRGGKGGMARTNEILDIQVIDPINDPRTESNDIPLNNQLRTDLPKEISVKKVESNVERVNF